MHHHCEVYIPSKVMEGLTTQEELYNYAVSFVENVMAPFQECDGSDCPEDIDKDEDGNVISCDGCENSGGFYDWYVVGGRWTGALDGYKPWEDPQNYESCDLCDGTGLRTDEVGKQNGGMGWCRGCNACKGTGMKKKWHNQPHPGDLQPLSKVSDELICSTLIINGEVVNDDSWSGPGIKVKEALAERGITEGYLVTVDYHS